MAEERTYKITCNVCGYSEKVSSAQLTYEEGKTCPRCYKGKMYWVPAEEARGREVRRTTMPEERKISLLWLIPIGIILGVGGGLALALAVAGAAPPTVYTCPHCGAEFDTEEERLAHIELEHPELPPPANLYGVVTDAQTGYPIAGVKVTIDGLVTSTDSSGRYAFEGLTPGSYTITFEKEGYETEVR